MALSQLKNLGAVVKGAPWTSLPKRKPPWPSSARASSVPGKLWVLEAAYFTPKNSTQAHIHKCKNKAEQQQQQISDWGPAKKSARTRL